MAPGKTFGVVDSMLCDLLSDTYVMDELDMVSIRVSSEYDI